MKSWIISVVFIVILTSVLGLLLPKGKTSALIKSIFSTLSILILINPLLNLTKTGDFNNFFEGEINVQENFLYYSNMKKIENCQVYCKNIIENKGLKTNGVKIEYEIDNNYLVRIKKVNLNIVKSVISTNAEHKIIIEDVKNTISIFLGVKSELLVIYE